MVDHLLPPTSQQTGNQDNAAPSTSEFQRSELAEEIVSAKPSFGEKWALAFFLGPMFLLFLTTWFIYYPDTVEASGSLTSEGAPKEIAAHQPGRLIKLFVRNSQFVQKSQQLGWIESTAKHEEVLKFSDQLDSIVYLLENNKLRDISRVFNEHFSHLGEIQQAYQQFVYSKQTFEDYFVNDLYFGKKASLEDDLQAIDKSRAEIVSQRSLLLQDIKLAEKLFNMSETLYVQKVISNAEYLNEKSKLVAKRLSIPPLLNSLENLAMQRRDKQKELDQLVHDIGRQKSIFSESLNTIKSIVDDWKKKFIIQSPIDGRISFILPLQENQDLVQGKLLGYVSPGNSNYFVQSYLPQSNFGKIEIGSKVQLRFNAYPYQDFGFVPGSVAYISDVPADSGFLAIIRLDQGLLTTRNISVPYKNGLKAEAIIITKSTRLLQRLFNNVRRM